MISYFADPPIEENEQTRVEAATEVLEIALRDILREEMGETYSVSVGLSQATPQRGGGHIDISFSASPDNLEKMIGRVKQEVVRLQTAGPTDDLTNRAKETARRAFETSVKQNNFWLGRLQSAKLLGRDPMLILSRLQRIDAVTPTVLHETFKKYFPAGPFHGRHAGAGEGGAVARSPLLISERHDRFFVYDERFDEAVRRPGARDVNPHWRYSGRATLQ